MLYYPFLIANTLDKSNWTLIEKFDEVAAAVSNESKDNKDRIIATLILKVNELEDKVRQLLPSE